MSDRADNLTSSLIRLGLEKEEATLYLHLFKQEKSTALQLSKELKLARTKIYRLLEKLINKGLVKEEVREYGTKYIAESYEKLNQMILTKEDELAALKDNAPKLFNQLAMLRLQSREELRVLHYRGVEGLKQVSWNSTKVEGTFRIYEVSLLHSVVDKKFAEKCRREFGNKPFNKFLQLTNATKFEDYTEVTSHIDQWEPRHIPKKELDIRFEIQVYNNVTCMFEYGDKDIFIVEVYNKRLADMQKQIFDLVWQQARPMRKISPFGQAVLV